MPTMAAFGAILMMFFVLATSTDLFVFKATSLPLKFHESQEARNTEAVHATEQEPQRIARDLPPVAPVKDLIDGWNPWWNCKKHQHMYPSLPYPVPLPLPPSPPLPQPPLPQPPSPTYPPYPPYYPYPYPYPYPTPQPIPVPTQPVPVPVPPPPPPPPAPVTVPTPATTTTVAAAVRRF